MAANRVGRTHADEVHSSDLGTSPEHGGNLQKRQARVTVKYNRKELQRRLDVEKWIDDCLNELYLGKEEDMPDEVNIDDLIDLPSNEERVKKLQEILQTCSNNTETFIGKLLVKLEGLHKQEELATEGIEHPSLCNHPQHRHEPYHFNDPHCPRTHTHTHQTL
uniref:protein phosphatase 1 regulatory subunit 14A-like n=1 Tax=Oncorhynchus gorbuscha TaxID=8017 RepID=UPI001EAEE988|nr:protein phosphatase 1 regulatory subunit 14A-like [Oncorhynchus gorbuscha]